MKLSTFILSFLLKMIITTSIASDLEYLSEPVWRRISVKDSIPKTIIDTALPSLVQKNSTKLAIVEAIVSASYIETLDLSGGLRYFIKTIIGETSVQNTTGSSKLCTIQLYYVPTTNQFGNNIVKCWELKNANNDSLIDKAIETALTIIGQQIEKADSVSLMEVDRAYYFSFDTSHTWFDKKYYLKLKVNSASNEASEILACSGEIDLASVLPDSFMTDGFYCQ